ncbi:Mitotic spindle checkpoint component mad2 [Pichia californica]|uniref:Mitotic spindle checkpoint component mad2 n=1 Tax=Pichia californica TaxID=460514 RepID=A0A9P6WPF6_9ASCO|nr:Mitotic spindle checkpoint component mad2 [[Candida] californica]KAG0690700.1 Mitotic spindle checkpoint component mad2 [[Candida] californica]
MDISESRTLNIKGSSRLISDYFEICIHNILFQRHVYPKEDFKVIRKFGLNLVYSKDDDVIRYIKQIIKQLHRWIYDGKINWITLLIVSKDSNQITEKWMFHIDFIKSEENILNNEGNIIESISMVEIQKEIQSIIRQITSSINILPEFEEPQTFKILVHTTTDDFKTPNDWDDAKPFNDMNGNGIQNVKFSNISTDNHKVSTFVTYQTRDQ